MRRLFRPRLSPAPARQRATLPSRACAMQITRTHWSSIGARYASANSNGSRRASKCFRRAGPRAVTGAGLERAKSGALGRSDGTLGLSVGCGRQRSRTATSNGTSARAHPARERPDPCMNCTAALAPGVPSHARARTRPRRPTRAYNGSARAKRIGRCRPRARPRGSLDARFEGARLASGCLTKRSCAKPGGRRVSATRDSCCT